MQLLNVITARAVWLFDVVELNPRGKALFPDLFEWLKGAYDFQKTPSSLTDVDETKAFVCSNGQYQAKEEIFVNVDLKIYNDGLIANTQSSTRDAEHFLEDVLISASAEFNLNFRPEMIRKKLYLSEMNVSSLKNVVNPGYERFAAKIAQATSCNGPFNFEFGGVSFWPRQTFPPLTVAAFYFERKQNTDRDQHKYFSRAPLQTDDHLQLLTEFEAELMA
jgi:hypothetical protein